jgi:uncharacterized protein
LSVYLLDVNVLVALALKNHVFHSAASIWLAGRVRRWASCPLTQLGLARIVMLPEVAKVRVPIAGAIQALRELTADTRHEFWPDALRVDSIGIPLQGLQGHKELNDAYLVRLAELRDARVATFDRGMFVRHGGDRVELIPV